MWQLLMNLSEKSTYFVHNFLSCGKAISNHGFALPLKWTTPALSASPKLVFSWYPNPSICQKGSITWTWPWNAINPGGNVPSCHKLRSDLIFYINKTRNINIISTTALMESQFYWHMRNIFKVIWLFFFFFFILLR